MSDNMTTNYVRHLVQQGRWVELATHIEKLQSRVLTLGCNAHTWEEEALELGNEKCLLIEAGDGIASRLKILGAKSDFSMYFIKKWEAAKEGEEYK